MPKGICRGIVQFRMGRSGAAGADTALMNDDNYQLLSNPYLNPLN